MNQKEIKNRMNVYRAVEDFFGVGNEKDETIGRIAKGVHSGLKLSDEEKRIANIVSDNLHDPLYASSL